MKWQYRTVKLGTKGFFGGILDEQKFEEYMNRLGQEGWELVTTFDTNRSGGITGDVVAIFKRPA